MHLSFEMVHECSWHQTDATDTQCCNNRYEWPGADATTDMNGLVLTQQQENILIPLREWSQSLQRPKWQQQLVDSLGKSIAQTHL